MPESFLIKLQAQHEFLEISKNTFSYRTPPVDAFVKSCSIVYFVVVSSL